jgi:hypothetical protein
MNKYIIMAVVSLATGVAWAQTPTAVAPQGSQLYTLVAGPDGQQVLIPASGQVVQPQVQVAAPQVQVQVPQGAVVTAPPPNQIMPLSGTAAAQYNVAAAQMAVRRTGDPNAQAALDNARLQLLQQQLAERQAQQVQAQAMRAQREYERQIRMRQAEIDRFHRQRAQRIGWVADWALTRPR